MTLMIGDSRWR